MKPFFNVIILLISLICINTSIAQKKQFDFQLIDQQAMLNMLKKQRVNFEETDLAYIKDLKSFVNFNNSKLVVPDYFIYNKEGYLMRSMADKDVCGALIEILDNHLFKVDENSTLATFLEGISFTDKNQKLTEDTFTVFVTWGSFANKSSNKDSFNNYAYIKKHYPNNVKIFLLNLDLQASWNLTDKQKELLKL